MPSSPGLIFPDNQVTLPFETAPNAHHLCGVVNDPISGSFFTFTLNGLEIPNRIVMAPMTRSHSPGGHPTQDVADYYRRRAEGGVGLIITEAQRLTILGEHG